MKRSWSQLDQNKLSGGTRVSRSVERQVLSSEFDTRRADPGDVALA
jgi:hypothetical protein